METKRGPVGGRRPICGFLAARFDEAYQYTVWQGAVAEAERLGLSLVFFGGQRLRSPIGYEALDNIAYDLAGHGDLAGLIVMSNVIGTYISAEEQMEFLGRYRSLERVTVGLEFPGIENVRVEAKGAMGSLASHLVKVHGRRRFLFLAGPAGHGESEARRAEFLGSLQALLPDLGPVPVVHADFTEEVARCKVLAYLDQGLAPDAIVAANDRMAIGAMAALAERGLDFPAQVSITGYDDTEDSRFSLPPLTTIRQPAAELGALAMDRLAIRLGLLEEAPPVHPQVSLVIRESCGCPPRPELGLGEEASRGRGGLGLVELQGEVARMVRAGLNPGSLRLSAQGCSLGPEALAVIAEGEGRYLATQRLIAEKRGAILGEIEASLVSSFRIEDILGEIARGSRNLGISGCWLSLFESRGPTPEWSKLLLTSDGKGEAHILSPHGLRFRTVELLPGGLPSSHTGYVCVPLRFGDDRLGYLICTADSTDRRIYEALRDQVSSAIKGAVLMAAEKDREKDLERMVRARTLELSTANARLVEEMTRRKKLEGELLEVSNLIMGDIGRDIHDNLCQDIAGLGIMAALLEGQLVRRGLAQEAAAAASMARGAGETAAKARDMARGLYPAELEARGIVSAIESLTLSAKERSTASMRLEVSPGFGVPDSGKALQLYRIVQEALGNAIRHSKAGTIRVGLYLDREAVTVEVSDDGVGIPATAGEEGGMGLHILKYRASVIGGELRVRSTAQGTSVSCRVAR